MNFGLPQINFEWYYRYWLCGYGRERQGWDIFVNGKEVGWVGTWNVEENEDLIFNSDIGGINLKEVLGFGG